MSDAWTPEKTQEELRGFFLKMQEIMRHGTFSRRDIGFMDKILGSALDRTQALKVDAGMACVHGIDFDLGVECPACKAGQQTGKPRQYGAENFQAIRGGSDPRIVGGEDE